MAKREKQDAASRYAAFFEQAGRKTAEGENSTSISTEVKKAVQMKTVTFKAPDEVSHHWVIEARRRRTTVSELCRQALTRELGLPEGWTEEDL